MQSSLRQGAATGRQARVFAIGTGSCALFHGGNPPRFEGRQFENVDRVRYLRKLLAAGAAGGGHVEYKFDNPTVRGDEETGSPKIARAIGFGIPNGKPVDMVASGIDPER